MGSERAGAVLRYIRNLAVARADELLPDRQLLERFATRQDQSAYTCLLKRHGPMVLSVCHSVLQDPHEAEDAFQATFVVLVQKADSIHRQEAIAGWLFRVAHHIATKARAKAIRRRIREGKALTLQASDPLVDMNLREVREVLYRELQHLPEKYRVTLVLCYLEEKTQEEAARLLGWPKGAVKGRLERGREQLRARLSRRGLELSMGLFVTALAQGSATAAVPTSLADSTLKAALLVAAGKPLLGALPVEVASLVRAATKSLFMSKMKGMAMLVLATSLAVAGTGIIIRQTPPAPSVTQSPEGSAKANGRKSSSNPSRDRDRPDPKPAIEKQARNDLYGDPLPVGAIARVGTTRFRQGSQVYCVAFSPDGRQIASGSYHGDLCLWDRDTGKLVRRFVDPLQDDRIRFVTSVAFSPDGEILASNKGKAALWEVRSGKLLHYLDKSFSICAMTFSPDGKSLALATDDAKGIWIFDPATGKASRPIAGHAGNVTAVAFSKDGKVLASGGTDKTARIWDFVTGKELHLFEPQVDRLDRQERVMDVVLAPDNKLLAVQTTKQVSLWEVTTGREVHRFPSERRFWSLAFSPDGTRLASANQIWDANTGQELCRLEGLPSSGTAFDRSKTLVPVTGGIGGIVTGALAFAPDGKALASGGYDGLIRLHDPTNGTELPSPIESPWNRGTMWVCGFAPDGRWLALRDNNGIHLCDTRSGKEIRRLTQEGNDGVSLAQPLPVTLSPDGKVLVAVDAKAIYRWDTATGKELNRIPRPNVEELGVIAALAFAPDGKTFVCAHYESTIRLWDTITGKQLDELNTEESGFCQLFFSPDGKSLFSEALNHTIQHWDLATHKELTNWQLPFGWVQAFSPDGKTVAAGGRRGPGGTEPDLVLCDLTSRREMRRFTGIKANYCAFSADGRLLAVDADPHYYPDRERTIQVLEVASGKVRAQFAGHFGFPGPMAFSADDRMLATGSSDTTALIWDVTGQMLRK